MSLFYQHIFVLLLVAGCGAVVFRQAFRTLAGQKSRLGSCCGRGCARAEAPAQDKPAGQTVFMPVESLRVRSNSGEIRRPK